MRKKKDVTFALNTDNAPSLSQLSSKSAPNNNNTKSDDNNNNTHSSNIPTAAPVQPTSQPVRVLLFLSLSFLPRSFLPLFSILSFLTWLTFKKQLFVGNLSFKVTALDLEYVFIQFGKLVSSGVKYDDDNKVFIIYLFFYPLFTSYSI